MWVNLMVPLLHLSTKTPATGKQSFTVRKHDIATAPGPRVSRNLGRREDDGSCEEVSVQRPSGVLTRYATHGESATDRQLRNLCAKGRTELRETSAATLFCFSWKCHDALSLKATTREKRWRLGFQPTSDDLLLPQTDLQRAHHYSSACFKEIGKWEEPLN